MKKLTKAALITAGAAVGAGATYAALSVFEKKNPEPDDGQIAEGVPTTDAAQPGENIFAAYGHMQGDQQAGSF